MMAAAEARAAWQRTANRCFVQEDAKRAPKLACCQSASSSSKQLDGGPANETDGHDKTSVGFMPLNRNPSYSNLSPESRWWLHMQPNYGYQKVLRNEELYTLEADLETFRSDVYNLSSKSSEVDSLDINDQTRIKPSFDTCNRSSALCMKKNPEVERQLLKTVYSKSAQESPKPDSIGESFEFVEMDPVGSSVSKQEKEISIESDSPWIGAGKTEPWWRTADRDELAYLVAQRSLDLIENCDLPQPQNTHNKRDSDTFLGHLDNDEMLPSYKDFKAQTHGLSNPNAHGQGSLSLGSSYRKQWASFEEQSQYGPDKFSSDVRVHRDATETQIADGEPSKAQLLEALRHSQTRAREAEKAAKVAHAERDHILKLFFRQASHLFAYKQWLQLLQLENLYFQMKTSNQPISSLLPLVLPWMPLKTRKLQKSSQKPVKGKLTKRGRPRHDINKLTVAFALGFSLVGAGLLLGWTIGWMLPTF